MSITHAKVSAIPDGADTTLVRHTDWNAAHVGSNLAVKDEGVSLDSAVTSLDFTGAGVTATAVGHAVTVAVSGGGATPTLAEVLAAGNDTGGLNIVTADDGAAHGAAIGLNQPSAAFGYGSGLVLQAGASPNAIAGAFFQIEGGEEGNTGVVGGFVAAGRGGSIAGNYAGAGQTFVGTGQTGAMALANIYSQAAAAPTTFTTVFYGDTTAVTGGLYVWNGSAYRKLTGVLP